jgi:hypothetical protein
VTAESAHVVSVELGFGEALVRQSSGRSRAQPVLGLGAGVGIAAPWGVAVEATTSYARDRSDVVAIDQLLVRPALLATLTFPRGRSQFELGLGPHFQITAAHWSNPAFDTALIVEPGVRTRAALAMGVGPHAHVRIQGGLAWRVAGVDADAQVGAAWAF